jgi:hypothetical protein
LYADDVVMFLQLDRNELLLIKEILRIFGVASGLVTNIRKSSATPIRCQEHDLEVVQDTLPCSVVNFPCKYLGLPLSVRKLSKSEFLLLIEKIADYLPRLEGCPHAPSWLSCSNMGCPHGGIDSPFYCDAMSQVGA